MSGPFTDNALAYHQRGWFTIPCCWPTPTGHCWCGRNHQGRDIGKLPVLNSVKPFFTSPPSLEQVFSWAMTYPSANVGILLQPSALLIIDTDSEDAEAEVLGLGVYETLTTLTAHGRHRIYRRPPSCPITRRTKGGTSRAIDVLTAGYCIVPPSRHRSGRIYSFLDAEALMAPAPDWAINWLRAVRFPSDKTAQRLELSLDLPNVDIISLGLPRGVVDMVVRGEDPRHPSPSETRWQVLCEMVEAGHTDAVIAGVLLNPAHGIHATLRGRGRAFIAGEIRRARAKSRVLVL